MSAGQVTLADITAADWSLRLNAIGDVVQGINDVDQCIAIILTTPQGSDPLRPTFGADLWRYIDNPINLAIPAIVREVSAAITMWEPRVTLQSVNVTPVNDGRAQSGAHLNVAVTWQLNLNGAPSAPQVTTVSVSGGS
jgi:uncharacterized protein